MSPTNLERAESNQHNMNKKNHILHKVITIIILLLLNNNSYSQDYPLVGRLLNENGDAILFSSVAYTYLDSTGIVISNVDGYFFFENLKKGGTIKLQALPIEYSQIDTTITISDDTIFLFFKLPCIIDEEYVNEKLAINDIAKGRLRIVTSGGIAPVVYKNDASFEKEYNITFWTNGCQPIISNKCKDEYNRVIFEFLDEKYGKIWRKEIRPDVLKK